MNLPSQLHHSLYTTMMLDTKTFIPRYHQLKLHIEAQILSGVWETGDQISPESGGDDYASQAKLTSENLDNGYKTYGALRYCS